MGLYYNALERADRQAGTEDPEAGTETPPPAPISTWEQARERDLAGFPLTPEERPSTPAAAFVPPAAADVAWDRTSLKLEANESGFAREQFRILRTRLLEAIRVRHLRSILITSARAGEGKTMISANLALQFSSLKEGRVLLVDADLRRAGLSDCLRPAPTRGLEEYLKGNTAWTDLLLEVDPWLRVLPAMRAQEEGAELLTSQRLPELLEQARERFDLVLVDGAPVGPVADSQVLARACDASLLVVRDGLTPFAEIQQAADLLRPSLLGSVLNGSRQSATRYGYSYGAPPAAAGAEGKE